MAVRAFTLLPARRLLSYKQFLRSLAFGPHPTLRNAFTHFPTTDTCPDPTCACSSTPTDLDINYKLPLAGTKPPYAQHIVVCTGHEDWSSRIEDDAGPNLAKELKALLGPKGRFHNPSRPVFITNASFPTSVPSSPGSASAYLFPSFQYIPHIDLSTDGLELFVQSTVLKAPTQSTPLSHYQPPATQEITSPVILICGHGGRDRRCGVMGPLLQTEFRRAIDRISAHNHIAMQVALVSHTGGHKFAGNVIVYIPPGFRTDGEMSPLAGQGVWYGRVEPRHVEGILAETVGRGRVVGDLVRGYTEWESRVTGGS